LTTTAIGPSPKPREVSRMYSLELSRVIAADRAREVERAMRHRRLLEILVARPIAEAGGGSRPVGRAIPSADPCAPALGPAR
jgi:hypothetical protein